MSRREKIRATKANRPTHKILTAARLMGSPVTIRWSDAAAIYRDCSESAREDERRGDTHYHLNLRQIFKRYFRRVRRGHYVLKENPRKEGEDASQTPV